MNPATLLGTAALGLSVAAFAIVISSGDPSDGGPQGESVERAGDSAALSLRMDELEAENGRLRAALAMLEAASAAPKLAAPSADPARLDLATFATREELDELREELMALLESGGAAGTSTKAIEGQVVATLKGLERERAVAKLESGLDGRDAKREGRVGAWSKWLDLDSDQQTLLDTMMADRDARDREVLDAWKGGLDDAEAERLRNENERSFYDSVRSILGPEQAERMNAKTSGGK